MAATDITKITDSLKFNRFHLQLLICCIFIIVCDGYDMFMLGAILPALMEEWAIDPLQAGALASYALIGMMLGAMIFGPVADKIGRKNVILICTVIFSFFTFTSGFSTNVTSFGIQRFIAGIGLGGVMPNLIALVTEYSPKKLKSTLVAVMFSGHALGGVVAAVGAIYLLPAFGWRSIVWLGVLPLLFLPIIYKVLPESINFYLLKNKTAKVAQILNKMDTSRHYSEGENFTLPEEKEEGSPVKNLFMKKRGISTILFWLCFFMCLFVMYGLSTWLPKIMQDAGFPMGSSLTFLLALNIGAVVGAIVGGQLADHFGTKRILIIFFLIAFVSLTVLSFKPSMVLLYLLIALAGGTTTGTQIVANSYVSQYYPSSMRSTGIGWALGVGRFGGMIGPALGGIILGQHLSLQTNFMIFAIPCIIAAIAIWFVQEKYGQVYQEEEQERTENRILAEDL